MSKTYKYLSLLSTGIRYANADKITDTLTFTGQAVRIPGSVNGKTLSARQNVISLNVPVLVLPEGCTDQCSALPVTLSVKVSFSGPAQSAAALTENWTAMKAIVDEAIADNKILQGFKPSANDTFVIA